LLHGDFREDEDVPLKFMVYDVDNPKLPLERQDFIGELVTLQLYHLID
jgi:hypothetical protein